MRSTHCIPVGELEAGPPCLEEGCIEHAKYHSDVTVKSLVLLVMYDACIDPGAAWAHERSSLEIVDMAFAVPAFGWLLGALTREVNSVGPVKE